MRRPELPKWSRSGRMLLVGYRQRYRGWLLGTLAWATLQCGPDHASQMKTGSQTNWLTLCESSAECGGLECVCGVCSSECASDAQCSGLAQASCVPASDPGAVAVCGGRTPPSSLCLPRCDEESGSNGTHCLAGVLAPAPKPELRVSVNPDVRYQTLVGVGASLAYAEDEIVAHPDAEALFDVMFLESGFDAVRFRNRYADDDELQPTRAILEAARGRLGTRPTLFITSATPPAELKANESRRCSGDPASCMLRAAPDGGFDYVSFATYWSESLDAHAELGIVPDYVSIQNDPDWVPDPSISAEACRFLPQEGQAMVPRDGRPTPVAYPGYREALGAVRSAFSALPNAPALVAPETTEIELVGEYVEQLEDASYDALAYHLYGTDIEALDPAAFERLRELGARTGLPVFQTEMRADGLTTAVLLHYSMAVANAGVYLQNDFVASASEGDPHALIALSSEGFETQGPYHALRHYARYTGRGWVRVEAGVEVAPAGSSSAEAPGLLSSAWLSSEGDQLTVVLVNPGASKLDVLLEFPSSLLAAAEGSVVERTVFEGVERSASLGALPSDGIVSLPAGAMLTVSLR